jgi:hypothetical protein
VLETEAVIRAALGEPGISVEGINPLQLLHIRGAVVAYLIINRKADIDVDELIVEAENVAFSRGWHPPLAT